MMIVVTKERCMRPSNRQMERVRPLLGLRCSTISKFGLLQLLSKLQRIESRFPVGFLAITALRNSTAVGSSTLNGGDWPSPFQLIVIVIAVPLETSFATYERS
eukprot:6176743-Pleurochrysis_carterae.AAC.1